jgi:ABC-type transport system substrate-binding protein
LKSANNTLLQEDRKGFYAEQQAFFTAEVPVIPLFNRTETFSVRADMTGFVPTPGEEYYVYNANEWAVPGSDTIVLGLTQEPASLFGLVEDAFVAHIVLELLGANDKHGHTTLNYEAQADSLVEIPTIENGRVLNNDLEVSAGEMVVDADGNVAELAAGLMVRNSAGEVVEFTGDPVTMKQLVVNYEFRSDLFWPDGSPLTQEDIELGWAIQCDKESGATSFITCDKTASFTVDGLVATPPCYPATSTRSTSSATPTSTRRTASSLMGAC